MSLFYVIIQFNRINYPRDQNPDFPNYNINYTNSDWAYDLGFECYQSLFRDYLHFDFNLFWVVTLLIICGLYFFYSKRLIQLPFFIINLTFMAAILGTQIRYFLAVVLFVFSINLIKNKSIQFFLLCLSCFIHYSLGIVFIIYIFSNWFANNYSPRFFFENKLTVLFFSVILFLITIPALNFFISYTRFSYYENSYFMESKSLGSLIYIILNLVVFLFISNFKLFNRDENRVIFIFSIMLLIFCYITSSIAVLSGRILLFYVMLETVTIKIFMMKMKLTFLILFFCLYHLLNLHQ